MTECTEGVLLKVFIQRSGKLEKYILGILVVTLFQMLFQIRFVWYTNFHVMLATVGNIVPRVGVHNFGNRNLPRTD